MHICNPMNLSYPYQFHGKFYKNAICREGADPSMVLFKGRYYLFVSMSGGFWISDDMVSWEYHSTPNLPIHDYAPDVRVVGDYMYFCASKRLSKCTFYRTKDPLSGNFEKVAATMTFWDPHLFCDDDGRIYFYWGCSNTKPIFGVELNPETMQPIGKPVGLIKEHTDAHGFERNGENHIMPPPKDFGEKMFRMLAGGEAPYIEGAWMNKHNGKYYLQYAATGAEYNVYSDGVYIGDSPLGPFKYAENNPYSYRPSGFMPGAGHGSTMEDKHGNLWHASTMRISVNHNFERRVGLFPAGFDEDGELFCNQRYGDWPMRIEQKEMDPWKEPEWMLLSCGKPMSASSCDKNHPASMASEECEQTWWKASSSKPEQWLEIDLQRPMSIHGIQINFMDDALKLPLPEGAKWGGEWPIKRVIDTQKHYTRWLLEGSLDGKKYFTICDKRNAQTDLSHDFISLEDDIKARFIRCTIFEIPFNQTPSISALRVFGLADGEKPTQTTDIKTVFNGELDVDISWLADDKAVGYTVMWGHEPDKLYHSIMVYGKNSCHIAALNANQACYLRIDSFNESGIVHGKTQKIR
ncbi:MAG: family 43 glycosylhydrolase [Clostridium sp.]|nr:family 43 glycosylhydrolase [Clostridium sp.]